MRRPGLAAFEALLAVCVLMLTPAALAQVYKWVDRDGKTHYGEKPPDGVKATEVGVPPPGPASAPDAWKQREIESRQRRIERERGDDAARAEERDSAVRQQRCNQARKALGMLKESIRVFSRNEKGERVYLEDNDRPAAIAAEERNVRENCR